MRPPKEHCRRLGHVNLCVSPHGVLVLTHVVDILRVQPHGMLCQSNCHLQQLLVGTGQAGQGLCLHHNKKYTPLFSIAQARQGRCLQYSPKGKPTYLVARALDSSSGKKTVAAGELAEIGPLTWYLPLGFPHAKALVARLPFLRCTKQKATHRTKYSIWLLLA